MDVFKTFNHISTVSKSTISFDKSEIVWYFVFRKIMIWGFSKFIEFDDILKSSVS